ncbi:MAG TPA: dipicolinate synthase subunit DpsA [Bacillota bacterium]|nr:dipicolinate synthase subunit DpsA [Bacillota bacterium]HNT02442.1 dipicolinate synthase subunit DpsA [Bacillota bacterium]HQQ45389.1 dipicolinate synthase subunit DpsA [Bacillota bacterium]
MKSSRYLIIGGDDRLVELAKLFEGEGADIATYGMDMTVIKNVPNYLSFDEALENSDIVIGPIPFAKDVHKINSKYSSVDIEAEELFSKLGKDKKLILGAINNYSKGLAEKYGIEYWDYHNDEGYQILNAIPTAEGALSILVNETKTTLFGSRILILGYGRIGKLLSEYLKALGASLYVEARKDSDLSWITAERMKAIPLKELPQYLGEMEIIINTVPAMLLDSNMLDLVKQEALILDLASAPGGTDFDCASKKGIKAIHAQGIPGKAACKSAAEYIYSTIKKYLCADRQKGV